MIQTTDGLFPDLNLGNGYVMQRFLQLLIIHFRNVKTMLLRYLQVRLLGGKCFSQRKPEQYTTIQLNETQTKLRLRFVIAAHNLFPI